MTRQIDRERGLPGAAIVIDHHVAALQYQASTVTVDERVGARLVNRGERFERHER